MKRWTAGLGLLVAAMAAQAGSWQAGGGVGVAQSWYRGADNRASALPLVGYQGEQFYFQGAELGWKQSLGEQLSITAKAEWEFERFKPKDSDIAALRQLGERKHGVLVGGELAWALDARTGLSLSAMHDPRSRHKSTLTAVAVEHVLPFSTQQDQFSVSAGASYLPKAYMQYYTGVSAAEAARSGLPAYQADAATRYQLQAGWRHGFNRQLGMMVRLSVSHLPADIKWQEATRSGSPMIARNVSVGGLVGLSYRY